MNIRVFSGKSMEEALDAARKELGQNVTVLESKEIQKNKMLGNKPNIQLTVTADIPLRQTEPNDLSTGYDQKGNHKSFNTVVSEMQRQIDETNISSSQNALSDEVKRLKEELSTITKRFRSISTPNLPEPFTEVFDKLIKYGFAEEHVKSLVRRAFLQLGEDSLNGYADVMAIVYNEVDKLFDNLTRTGFEVKRKQKIITVFGSTGSGKTTTLLKLASHPHFYGKQSVGIISLDTYRAGAMAPIKSFERISGIPAVEARSITELNEKLIDFSDKNIILVDTPGRGFNHVNYVEELENYMRVLDPIEKLLVLPVNTDIDDMALTYEIFKVQNPTGIIMTKFDETMKPGKAFSIMEATNLPINALCTGQSIPRDIQVGNTDSLWNLIFNGDDER